MAIKPVVRNVLTGKPVKPHVNVQVDRSSSEKGMLMSGVKNDSDFRNATRMRNQVSSGNLADRATNIPFALGKRLNISA